MLGFVTGRLAQLMEDYAAPYSDAPVFNAGDIVACGKTDPEWPGWIWCVSADGRSAWVPVRIIERTDNSPAGRILESYEATGLTAKAGETLVIMAIESGWALAENVPGRRGWIPESCLESRICVF